ncbi:type I restriction endonuclease subunit S [Veillonella sp. S12025-13]|uniref:Type I restriction endonuclease subunit S n=1 Tax=Veillonella orientalis TaxID=2682455 RepID=A0ABM7HF20_9FIRM|nr:restriction endonuclease subunit S [Veillonella sp. S12025-13]BBU35655.1 type I restriction endonuclease subunit S [Veillonella sp. S12025-13]
MNFNWDNKKIGDIVDIRRGASPRPIHNFLSTKGMPWVKIADATSDPSRYIWGTNEYIINKGVSKSVKVDPETLIVSNSATPGLPKIMKIEACVHDGWLVFSNYRGVTRDFLYYKFIDIRRMLVNQANGSVFQNLKTDIVRDFNIKIPSIDVQNCIVNILSKLDEKIELNSAINKNLLQQSLYIFETLINSTSKDGCIGDYCTLKSGFAFKSKWWQDSGIPVIKIGSINQDYLNLSNCSHVSEDKISLAKDFIVSGGDLLIAMTGATIGKFTMVPKMHKTILVNQRVGKFFLGENPINKIPFIYCTLKQPEIISEIINRGQGSAQPNISASDIMSIPCVIPQTDKINNFNLKTAPMFELIINNQFENLILAKMRDLLLPRLMSGEIDISNISF